MKKRLLVPFLVAGMMVASVAMLDSCKKNQGSSVDPIFTSGEAPMTDIVYYGDRAGTTCPYCGGHVGPGVSDHWHAFGTPPADKIYTGPTPYDVDYCCMAANSLLDSITCPYSGLAHDDEELITYYMNYFHIDREAAQERLLPRFHAHRIEVQYIGGSGGAANHWHVGGEVPWWPIIPQP